MKVKYTGASEAQINWGANDDPRPLLTIGEVYGVLDRRVHSWHTKIWLTDFPDKKFNDSSFEYIETK